MAGAVLGVVVVPASTPVYTTLCLCAGWVGMCSHSVDSRMNCWQDLLPQLLDGVQATWT